jgi:hypothetical protein
MLSLQAMSVDYEIVCDACKLKTHAGKSNLTGSYFGRSSGDTSVAEFAFEHAYHNIEGGVRIVISDTTEKKRSDSYLDEDNSDPAMVAAVATLKAGIEHAEALGQSVDSFLDGSTADFVQRFGETLTSKPTGNGDFSIGSKLWPGTSKVIEEMGELQQVLGKLIAVAGDTKHWDGDLRKRLIEEIGDLSAALDFFKTQNCTIEELLQIAKRANTKLNLFWKWHTNPTRPV